MAVFFEIQDIFFFPYQPIEPKVIVHYDLGDSGSPAAIANEAYPETCIGSHAKYFLLSANVTSKPDNQRY
jgi:hypothetical protein